ncbi:MAG: TRAP transporter substrate-binding protein DctP, partial [Desulfobacteraceae bacterium]
MRTKAEHRINRKRWGVPVAVLGSAMTIALLLIAAPFNALAQTTYEFRMAHSEAIGTPITEAFETWGKLLNERSGGRIVAKHFPAG